MRGICPISERDVPPKPDILVEQHLPVCFHLLVRRVQQCPSLVSALERAIVRDERRRHVDIVRPELYLALALRDRPVHSSWRHFQQVLQLLFRRDPVGGSLVTGQCPVA